MKLAIFDIDGTLTATSKVDESCYARAFQDEFGIDLRDFDYSAVQHFTDSGIMDQIFLEERGRKPNTSEITAVQRCFIHLLKDAFGRDPEQFRPLHGAVEMLAQLQKSGEWAIAFATGCWQQSAHLKLDSAGFDWQGLPLAHSDATPDRQDICRTAIGLAEQTWQAQFDKKVYIGDGLWDLRTANALGLGFIGIDFENHHASLAEAGADTIIGDYRDYTHFAALLNAA